MGRAKKVQPVAALSGSWIRVGLYGLRPLLRRVAPGSVAPDFGALGIDDVACLLAMSKPALHRSRLVSLLLVDDDVLCLRALVRVLSNRYAVLAVTSAARALDHVEDQTVAVVISDYDLGVGPNGVELLQRFRVARPEVRRVLISSYCLAHLVEGANGAVEHFVHKSAGAAKLVACVHELVSKAGA